MEAGEFEAELRRVALQRKGDPIAVDKDEEPLAHRSTDGQVRPAFDKNGTVTAANALRSTTAQLLVLMSADEAAAQGLKPLQRLFTRAMPMSRFIYNRTRRCGKKASIKLASSKGHRPLGNQRSLRSGNNGSVKNLELDESKVNVRGGAVALGHQSMLRCAYPHALLHALKAKGGKVWLRKHRIGGGEAGDGCRGTRPFVCVSLVFGYTYPIRVAVADAIYSIHRVHRIESTFRRSKH